MPLRVIGPDVNRGKPDKRICRNTHFMTIKVEIDIHEESLHETGSNVNFENKTCTRISGAG